MSFCNSSRSFRIQPGSATHHPTSERNADNTIGIFHKWKKKGIFHKWKKKPRTWPRAISQLMNHRLCSTVEGACSLAGGARRSWKQRPPRSWDLAEEKTRGLWDRVA